MNYATRSVLDEMESELLASLEDREERIDTWSAQAKHILSTLYQIVACYLSGFIRCLTLFFVISFALMPTEMISFITTASGEQIKIENNTVIFLAHLFAFFWVIFNVCTRKICFVSINRLKREAITQRVKEAKQIVEIAEEVLVRHELISIEDKR